MIPFNKKKHSDLTVTVSAGSGDGAQEQTFFLHKYPLVSKSHYFDENVPDASTQPGPITMKIVDFPGGPAAFETVAKFCYGIDIELSPEDIAYTYCACRYLRIPDLEKSTDAYMSEVVLPDPRKAARVLKVGTEIENMTEEMLEGLVGNCINAVAAKFAPIPELAELPPDCFACIVRNAKEMEADKRVLDTAVVQYLESRVTEQEVNISVDDFIEVVTAAGRMDEMRHCERVYDFLEAMLKKYKSDEEAESLCKALHDVGFWLALPHVVIERAYSNHEIPDKYCTVALMAENRHLIKVNERLAEQVEHLTDTLASATGYDMSSAAAAAGVPNGTAPPPSSAVPAGAGAGGAPPAP